LSIRKRQYLSAAEGRGKAPVEKSANRKKKGGTKKKKFNWEKRKVLLFFEGKSSSFQGKKS